LLVCGRGETGRRAGFRFLWGDSWGFKSLRPHHPPCNTHTTQRLFEHIRKITGEPLIQWRFARKPEWIWSNKPYRQIINRSRLSIRRKINHSRSLIFPIIESYSPSYILGKLSNRFHCARFHSCKKTVLIKGTHKFIRNLIVTRSLKDRRCCNWGAPLKPKKICT